MEKNKNSFVYTQDGREKKTTYTYFRGTNAKFHPTDETLTMPHVITDYMMKGWEPIEQFIRKDTSIVAFGSCFASNVSNYLHDRGYNILNKKDKKAYVSIMGDGIVNTFAIRQQFEWAWEDKQPLVELWHGFKAESFGYDEEVRKQTKELFDAADVFVITFGLSEVWYDEITNEVFWRAVPASHYDESRHKFRITTVEENFQNIKEIYNIIMRNKPNAKIVFTLSPIPLTATFRDIACVSANSISKAILRAAIDQLMRSNLEPDSVFYFPSFEVVTQFFNNAFMEDRKHPHSHVLDFNMKMFEKYFCFSEISQVDLIDAYQHARELDQKIGREGHFSVPRIMNPQAGGAVNPASIKTLETN